MLNIEQIAYDSGISSSSSSQRKKLMSLYQKQNIIKNKTDAFEHDGYGMRFKPENDPLFKHINEVFLANDAKEYYNIAKKIIEANDSYDVPSNGVLPWMTAVYTNKVLAQIFQTNPIWEIAHDFQQGTFGTTRIFIPSITYAGNAQEYTDIGVTGSNSINVNYVERDTITLERILYYGDLANVQFGLGKIMLVEQMRIGMNKQINIDINNIAFNGYAGREVYGVLNDPSLNPQIPFVKSWLKADFFEILADIRLLYGEIMANAGGNVKDLTQKCKLTIPPILGQVFATVTSLGITLESIIQNTFKGMEIVICPNNVGDNVYFVQLIMDELDGQQVLLNVFSQLYNSHGAIRKESSYVEKISYTVSGSIVAVAMGIATGTMSKTT